MVCLLFLPLVSSPHSLPSVVDIYSRYNLGSAKWKKILWISFSLMISTPHQITKLKDFSKSLLSSTGFIFSLGALELSKARKSMILSWQFPYMKSDPCFSLKFLLQKYKVLLCVWAPIWIWSSGSTKKFFWLFYCTTSCEALPCAVWVMRS